MPSRHIRGPLVYDRVKIVTSGNYSVVGASLVIVNKTVGAPTQITLPPSLTSGGRREVIIIDALGDAATNNITVVPSGSDTINGGSSWVISVGYGSTHFVDAGNGNWVIGASTSTGDVPGTATAGKAVILDANKSITGLGSVISTAPTGGGVGYGAGAGGTVTQLTNRSTGVTLSKLTGQITTVTTSLAAEAAATFVVTNTTVGINDVIVASIQSGSNGGNTSITVSTVTNGSFSLTVSNNNAAAGTAETGAIIINFVIIKGAAA